MENKEIRGIIENSRLRHYEIARELGITKWTFSAWLQNPLTDEKETKILNAIDVLSKRIYVNI